MRCQATTKLRSGCGCWSYRVSGFCPGWMRRIVWLMVGDLKFNEIAIVITYNIK